VLPMVAGFFVRGLIRTRVVEGSLASMVHVPIGSDVDIMFTNRRTRTGYEWLTSHPSYALHLLLTVPIPLSMWCFSRNESDSTFYWRITGVVGQIIIGVMAWRAYWHGTYFDPAGVIWKASRRGRRRRSPGSRADAHRDVFGNRLYPDGRHVLA
jgi:hypothetical protein